MVTIFVVTSHNLSFEAAMGEKRVGSVDLDTGEILEYSLVAMQRKIPNGFAEGWVAMAQNALDLLATSDLRGDDLKVLLYLLGRLDFENLIQIEQVGIASKLGLHKAAVSRSIRHLLAQGCVLEGPKIGRSRTYRLNPHYGWKGSAKEHQKALRASEKAAMAGFKIVDGGIS